MTQVASAGDIPAASAVCSMVGSARVLLQQVAVDAAHAAHGFDHVDRHADGAALVGDGAGDGLPDPPCRVGGELVTAGVFELVHRPHQARVPLLNQVQEAQTAVAIALGDGDDQPQVAGREVPLGAFVFRCPHRDALDAAAERGGAFQGDPHEVTEFLAQFLALAGRFAVPAQFRHLGPNAAHPQADLLEFVQGRLQSLRAQAEFLDQADRPATPAHQPLPGLPPLFARAVLVDGDDEVPPVAAHEVIQACASWVPAASTAAASRGC